MPDSDTKMTDSDTKMTDIDAKIDINSVFKLPIYYNDTIILNKTIATDLELISTHEADNLPLYHYYFNIKPDNYFAQTICNQLSNCYTNNITFLKDNQTFLKNYKQTSSYIHDVNNHFSLIKTWNEIKQDTGFKEKYQFVDWSHFEFLNNSEPFLQFMSTYNLIGPIFSVVTPFIILILPFFVLKLKNINVNFDEYINVLKTLCQNHALGKLFTTQFDNIDLQQLVYVIISAAFYIFSIYQNILTFIRFNYNMNKIHDYLSNMKSYLQYTILEMDNYLQFSNDLSTHSSFNEKTRENIIILQEFKQKVVSISEYNLTNYRKLFEIGHVLKTFYQLYDDKRYNDAFVFSFGFNGYIDCITGLKTNIAENKINFCSFSKENIMKNSYYGTLKDEAPVKNTINLSTNLTLTGPNASGKTTILKSTMINIICSQQFGCGFYDDASLNLYKYLHCYLNIPDTSGRDSLFQAEARRCKEIIDIVNENAQDRHFCIFDELYSGTNPEEAVLSATSFLEYLIKNDNVSCFLTTHFVKICKKLKTNKRICNYYMDVKQNNSKLTFKYKLKKGISTVKGGFNVLSTLNYPEEILNKTKV